MSHAFKLKITNNYVIIMLSFYIILESECAICINFLNLHNNLLCDYNHVTEPCSDVLRD